MISIIQSYPEEFENSKYKVVKNKLKMDKETYLKLKDILNNKVSNRGKNIYISSKVRNIYNSGEIPFIMKDMIEEIDAKQCIEKGVMSGVRGYIVIVGMKLYEFRPLKGSMYFDLPPFIKNKKAVINIKNMDEKCFIYSVLYGLYGEEIKKNPQELYHYKKLMNKVKFDNFNFPFMIKDIPKFEKLNDLKINVISYKEINKLNTSFCDFFHYIGLYMEIVKI